MLFPLFAGLDTLPGIGPQTAKTFAQMEVASRETSVLGVSVRVPCLEHLLAMKLFALEQGKRIKDMADIAELVRANGLDVNGPEFERLCLKFASARWLKFFRETR